VQVAAQIADAPLEHVESPAAQPAAHGRRAEALAARIGRKAGEADGPVDQLLPRVRAARDAYRLSNDGEVAYRRGRRGPGRSGRIFGLVSLGGGARRQQGARERDRGRLRWHGRPSGPAGSEHTMQAGSG
jgi:hypothetical protein